MHCTVKLKVEMRSFRSADSCMARTQRGLASSLGEKRQVQQTARAIGLPAPSDMVLDITAPTRRRYKLLLEESSLAIAKPVSRFPIYMRDS